jgi:hypothetical protein
MKNENKIKKSFVTILPPKEKLEERPNKQTETLSQLLARIYLKDQELSSQIVG